ncbi:MAG: TIGR01212 family radical SAM protein [Eubacterium sp.]|nr:TIGR01212 family radical SAM protein [Eubacterium sp.]
MNNGNHIDPEKTTWDGRPYYSFSTWLKQQFGTKVYKLSLDAGMTCPNRDGTIGYGGCIFCSAGGSGDFAEKPRDPLKPEIGQQIDAAKLLVSRKIPPTGPFIAYFQSFTNTYAPVSRLKTLFTAAIEHPEIAALSIATRPDCLEPEKIQLLSNLNAQKPVLVELGLQTIHPETAAWIRRGYPLVCFEDTVRRLHAAGIPVIVHLILGMPGESYAQMLQSIDYLARFSPAISGIKLQLLHILKGTDLAKLYAAHPFPLFTMDAYVDFAITCLEHLPPSMVIHRLTGDAPKKLLVAPAWSADKKRVLNMFTRRFRERGTWQGKSFNPTDFSYCAD